MPTFHIAAGDAKYEIDAPDESAAMAAFQGMGAPASAQAAPPPAPAGDKSYTGSVLPFSRDAQGNLQFDSNAGILGSLKSAITLPGDVATGKVDPMSEEVVRRSADFAGIASPVGTAIRAGDAAIPGALRAMRRDPVAPPTADALKAAGSAGYDAARDLGVDYSAGAVSSLAGSVRADLERDGILAELAPKTHAILSKFESPPEGGVAPLAGIEAARRALGHAGRDFTNPTEQLAANRVTQAFDGFVQRADPATVVAGPAADASRILADARGNYAAAMRSDKINGIEEAADLRAAAANSGQNGDNALRQRVVSVLQNPKQAAGFSEPEIAALTEVATGTPVRNATRTLGNLLGGGGGLGAAVTGMAGGAVGSSAGGGIGMIAGASLPIVGWAAKQAANSMTRRALGAADELVRTRSPLYEALEAGAPMSPISPERRAALARALSQIDYAQDGR